MELILGAIRAAIGFYILIVFAHAIMSWFGSMRGSQVEALLDRAVEPALKPIRSLIMPLQGGTGIDFSPAILIMVLVILRGLLS